MKKVTILLPEIITINRKRIKEFKDFLTDFIFHNMEHEVMIFKIYETDIDELTIKYDGCISPKIFKMVLDRLIIEYIETIDLFSPN